LFFQESERKLRINQQEMEKMREKLQFFVERDRTTRNRYTEILSGTAVAAISKGDSESDSV
jgi:cytidylate kinase